jgi:ribonuclease HII
VVHRSGKIVLQNLKKTLKIAFCKMLKSYHHKTYIEAGCDEAGRGCYAGPVFAAAVILPKKFKHKDLNDSKQVPAEKREELRKVIEEKALSFAVAMICNNEIDEINILQASFKAMHVALDNLKIIPEVLLIDGNRFKPYQNLHHHCIVEGDGIYASIAAASILAKTYRDDFMRKLHDEYPHYNWKSNKGYGTKEHRKAIEEHGLCGYHRRSFAIAPLVNAL